MMLHPVEFIMTKRDGQRHAAEDLQAFCDAYLEGDIPDYQAAAWLMAVYFNGLDVNERAALTQATVCSGETLDLSSITLPKVDKHSTGGVGDKTSLVLVPLLASADVCVPMMSGRGLGHTGGTLDKLEAIPGMRVEHSLAEYQRILARHHGAFMAQTPAMAPLDKRLYALRDVTGTVESTGLITASIIGKKATEDIGGLVLDVKFGAGAFMKTIDAARELARALADTATALGIRTVALLTDMHEPLGAWVGNAVEVREALAMLRGEEVERRFYDVTLALAVEMYCIAYPAVVPDDARAVLARHLADGSAFERMLAILEAQGVAADIIAALPDSLPAGTAIVDVPAPRDGYVAAIATQDLGRFMAAHGAGRMQVTDTIDPAIGARIHVRVGTQVAAGDHLCQVHTHTAVDPHAAASHFILADEPPDERPLIAERVI